MLGAFNKKETIRENLSFGSGLTTMREPQNWVLNTDACGTYYSWDNEKQNSVRLIINPKIEFPLTRFYGLTIAPMIQINKSSTYFGLGIG